MFSWYGILALSLIVIRTGATAQEPVVQLSHGGSLRGKAVDYNGTKLDLFLGIRYARPPVGDLRFKKPVDLDPWTGEVNAKAVGNVCWQESGGQEDCLFLDVTVPGGVAKTTQPESTKKAVMVWIHGGSFIHGTGSSFIGAPLAHLGDVIVVTINYRLGIFGFLSDGPGTGNFGLWDQRAAILWVKKNIENFGGDSRKITIFGESAGSASVHAQLLSAKNDDLFQRAILQSGPLFTYWAWYRSDRQCNCLVKKLKALKNCNTASVYDCFKGKTTAQVTDDIKTLAGMFEEIWVPSPDNDFFPENINDESNNLTKRFDVLAGFNGQEGALSIVYTFQPWGYEVGEPIEPNGISVKWASGFLDAVCKAIFLPKSPSNCTDLVMSQYGLSAGGTTVAANRQRLIDLSYFFGEEGFDISLNQLLKDHSQSNRTTYGYYFTEKYMPAPGYEPWPLPEWAKVSADHYDEIMFVWGAPYLKNRNDLLSAYVGDVQNWKTTEVGRYAGFPDSSTSLSVAMMTLWTNFANTGNPNTPKAVPGLPVWPQFDSATGKYLELKLNNIVVRDTPNKARLNYVYENLFKPRRLQVIADKATDSDASCNSAMKQASDYSLSLGLSVFLLFYCASI